VVVGWEDLEVTGVSEGSLQSSHELSVIESMVRVYDGIAKLRRSGIAHSRQACLRNSTFLLGRLEF
jgi:hypothetical protein